MNRFSALALSTVAIASSIGLGVQSANAQEIVYTENGVVFNEPNGVRLYETIEDEFEDAFFSHDETFYNNRSIFRQVSWLFGIGFPENEMAADGDAINELYEELLEAQSSTTPRIRTPDLDNPYATSLLQTPISEIGAREFESPGFRQPIPAPQTTQPTRTAPVPALW